MTNTAPNDNNFYINGINGSTGDYGLEPISPQQMARIIKGEDEIPDNLAVLEAKNRDSPLMLEILKKRLQDITAFKNQLSGAQADALNGIIADLEKDIAQREKGHLGVVEGINADKLDEAGWGIIFADKADPAIKEALSDLLSLRQTQAGEHFKVFEGADGYRAGESYIKFLARHGVGPGPANPANGVPYYLLIVGSPEEIPFEFQYQLDVQYAVGRIYFDELTDYEYYAKSVALSESGQVNLARQASFFGVVNDRDRATALSMAELIEPLYNRYKEKYNDWQFDLIARDNATKSQLSQKLNRDQPPALLFTASHGVEFKADDSRQLPHQGALLCQEWPGERKWRKPIPEEFYFAGDDLDSTANLLGMISFHFACYGAGTPLFDDFSKLKKEKTQIAPNPFVANLPKQLLLRGALATIGHIERAWGYSFFWPDAGQQLGVFESTLDRLFNGSRLGSAFEYFNERYAELATILNQTLDNVEAGAKPDDLPGLWTAHHDARNYIIIGDPAVRLPVVQPGETPSGRPEINTAPLTAPIDTSTDDAPTSDETALISSPITDINDEDWANTPTNVQNFLISLKNDGKIV